jgi:N-acetylneuraminate synthase
MGATAAIAATALGASAIEKHFTLSRDDKGPDSEFSIEPHELKDLIIRINDSWSGLGSENFERPSAEIGNKAFRRSLYFVKDLKRGDIVSEQNVRRIRPGFGLPPKFFDELIGLKLAQDVERGDPVSWDTIDREK